MYAVVVAIWLVLLFYYCQEMQYSDPTIPESRASRLRRREAKYQLPTSQLPAQRKTSERDEGQRASVLLPIVNL